MWQPMIQIVAAHLHDASIPDVRTGILFLLLKTFPASLTDAVMPPSFCQRSSCVFPGRHFGGFLGLSEMCRDAERR